MGEKSLFFLPDTLRVRTQFIVYPLVVLGIVEVRPVLIRIVIHQHPPMIRSKMIIHNL